MTDMISPNRALYNSEQLYKLEQHWFEQGHGSFGLMQQAAWQLAYWVHKHKSHQPRNSQAENLIACIWAGCGNNGGDGWLVAHYLQQFGWHVTVIQVAEPNTKNSKKAKNIAVSSSCAMIDWTTSAELPTEVILADIHIDAIFGIGLDRMPTGRYANAIHAFNKITSYKHTTAIALDIPSGLVASTGQVFDELAIKANITLCLIANKVGLFTKDGKDNAGKVHTLPLIPLPANITPIANLLNQPYKMPTRTTNSHKGSYGHVLVIGGNQTNYVFSNVPSNALGMGAQGMGGAGILAASAAFAIGAGKVSVACHSNYHTALLARLPNAMCMDLHNHECVIDLCNNVDIVAIGMGLGRDETAQTLFVTYIKAAMQAGLPIVIDADGLYHLATSFKQGDDIVHFLKSYSETHFVAYTPHTGEMATLLATTAEEVEFDRIVAVQKAAALFGGNWLLKGAGNIVYEDGQLYLCDVGNAGMATAGMGDVLAGMIAGLKAQSNCTKNEHHFSLCQAVLIHGKAGDNLANKIGQLGLQAQDMAEAVSITTKELSTT